MKKSRVMCVHNFGLSRRFLGVFVELPKIKLSPKTGVSQITKYLNINPILRSHYYIQKIIASMTCFCKTFVSSLTSPLCSNKNLLCKWRHYLTVMTLPDLMVAKEWILRSLKETKEGRCSFHYFFYVLQGGRQLLPILSFNTFLP